MNQLEAQGILGQLYQAGAVTLAVYSQREVYNIYHALLSTPRYFDQPTRAVEVTAVSCRMCRSSVYRALRCMEQQVGAESK